MTIEIYRDLLTDSPGEVHEWEGTISEFLDSQGCAHNARKDQPIIVLHQGAQVASSEWDAFRVSSDEIVKIRVVAHGIEWLYYAVAALMVYTLTIGKPTVGNRGDTPQGKSLSSAEATANVAKLNQAVPELAGRHIRRPDYLTPPRRYFADPRTQYLETLLCIGPGQYQIDGDSVKIGNTPLSGLPGAEFHIYGPGQSVAVNDMHGNWYSSPEVGGTSAGTAGLELSSEPVAAVQPPSGSLSFSGKTVTAGSGWPEGVGVGTNFSVWIPVPFVIDTVMQPGEDGPVPISRFTGDFSELEPLSVGSFVQHKIGSTEFELRVKTVAGSNPNRQVTFQRDSSGEGSYSDYEVVAGSRLLKFRKKYRQYQVVNLAGDVVSVKALLVTTFGPVDDPTWISFPTVSASVSASEFTITGGNVYGKWSGPYVSCPLGESSSSVDLDFFFPSGLGRISDSGEVESVTVQVEIQYRQFGSGSLWTSLQKVYSYATLDQIGFTERVTLGAAQRLEFRVRRTSAASTDTRTNDKVQWYGLRTLLESPTSYPGWTTIAIRIKGLGDIGASSENQINLIATRILPVLHSNGSWGSPQPTRDISAFVRYIANSVGYSDAQLDADEFLRLHNIWTSRGETADYIFNEGTVKSAIDICFGAGMSELTVEDGLLRPVRDGIRTTFEQSYSAQNTAGKITRAFTSQTHDDNDGVQVEYIDENDGYTTKTVDCILAGSPGFKLEKNKLPAVLDRTRAWRIGMRRARELRYQRWSYAFSTEMDALNSLYGGYVAIIPDIPDYGQSAIITRVQGQTITLSEIPEWKDGSNHVVAWRNPEGKLVGPFVASKGASAYEVIATVPGGTAMPVVSLRQEPPHAYFGTSERWVRPALVRKVSPDSESKVKVQAVNYDARVYADDNNSPG